MEKEIAMDFYSRLDLIFLACVREQISGGVPKMEYFSVRP